MDEALINRIKQDLDDAFESADVTQIKKETLFLFDRANHFLLTHGKTRLHGVTFETYEIDFNEKYLQSANHKRALEQLIQAIEKPKHFINAITFGRLRIMLHRLYYKLGGKEMYFDYKLGYLQTIEEAAQHARVSEDELRKWIGQGLEIVKKGRKTFIPQHAVEMWKHPADAIQMQMLTYEKDHVHFATDSLSAGLILSPANLDLILQTYERYLQVSTDLPLYGSYTQTKDSMRVFFPLKSHQAYGITGLLAEETYDAQGYITHYTYEWQAFTISGKQTTTLAKWTFSNDQGEGQTYSGLLQNNKQMAIHTLDHAFKWMIARYDSASPS